MRSHHYQLRRHWPSLSTLGIAVDHFPRYVNHNLSPHSLDVVLISFIVRGRGRHIIDDQSFAESGRSLAVTHYGQRHGILTDSRGMEIINVYLDLEHHNLPVLPGELQPVLPLLLPLGRRFQHRLNRIVRVQFDDIGPLVPSLMSIFHELKRREAGYEEVVAMQWKLFLIACCRHVLREGFVPPLATQDAATHRLEELRQHLDATYAQPHTLADLADRAQLSRTHLCRAFKSYTGKRVFDYLIERRIGAAMVRLRGCNDKVLSVALACGFHDLAYFNRKFKQIVGATPMAYRKAGQADR
ncbi:MAG: helix-turn-helix transcriptional regulator [Phycisphaeraceae bacterium]|nr:helix-turn-helix transcriptional regulator [Phycisphaeraceae bacterium]